MTSKTLFLTVLPFHFLVLLLVGSAAVLWRKPEWWPYTFALFCGALCGFIDLHSDEVQFPALLLLAFSFFLGFNHPRSAWRWGILIGIWIPLVQPLRLVSPELPAQGLIEMTPSLLSFVFSFVGAYGGALVNSSQTLSTT
jgi:hypothetical protein